MALTLLLVTVLVINRLDEYFTSQQASDLEQRSDTIFQIVESTATPQAQGRPVVGPDNEVDPLVLVALADHDMQRFIADRLGQADVQLTFGQYVSGSEGKTFKPANGDPIRINLEASPEVGQSQEKNVSAVNRTMAAATCSARMPC